MNRPVLFLDVDGVLNTMRISDTEYLKPALIAQLARVVDETDCLIVLSSYWRLMPKMLPLLEAALDQHGLKLHGMTPDRAPEAGFGIRKPQTRGNEIQLWMDENFIPPAICIVDDNEGMEHLRPRLVKTHPLDGLTKEKADEVIAMLKTPFVNSREINLTRTTPRSKFLP